VQFFSLSGDLRPGHPLPGQADTACLSHQCSSLCEDRGLRALYLMLTATSWRAECFACLLPRLAG